MRDLFNWVMTHDKTENDDYIYLLGIVYDINYVSYLK